MLTCVGMKQPSLDLKQIDELVRLAGDLSPRRPPAEVTLQADVREDGSWAVVGPGVVLHPDLAAEMLGITVEEVARRCGLRLVEQR